MYQKCPEFRQCSSPIRRKGGSVLQGKTGVFELSTIDSGLFDAQLFIMRPFEIIFFESIGLGGLLKETPARVHGDLPGKI